MGMRALVGLIACLLSACAWAQDVCRQIGADDCRDSIAFLHEFRAALEKNDKVAVALMLDYPVRATIKGKSKLVSRQGLLEHFDEIFDPATRCAILKSEDKDLFHNWQGYMIADGRIWWDKRAPKGTPKVKLADAEFVRMLPFHVITINNGGPTTVAACGGK